MPIVTLEQARAHLRVEADYPPEQVQPYLDAAIDGAVQFLGCAVYADAVELAAAKAAVPAALTAAAAARVAALAAADAEADPVARAWMRSQACADYDAALQAAQRTGRGIVVNASITAAVLLTLGHLDENREDVARGVSVTDLPKGAQYLLQPYRVGMGV